MINVTNVVKSTAKIHKITKKQRENVYDFTVRDVHRINANGFYTSNCHHPELLTFVNIKRDVTKVTGANVSVRVSNEFMEAVKNNTDYEQRFPVDAPPGQRLIERKVNAREVWDDIIRAMRDCSEPGILFWDTITTMSPADAYAAQGYKTVSTNPCLTGDTKIAVADGRGYVTFKELADEGRDVPVYCHQADTGKMIIRLMRNPRLTGHNIPVFKVTIEGGHTFKATGNHKMIMRDGSAKRIDELCSGDQLMISKRTEKSLVELGSVKRTNNPNHYVIIENDVNKKSEHRLIWEYHNGSVPQGHVIHHIDFDSKNNHISNLRCMVYKDHYELHANALRGDKNPIFKIKSDPQRFAEYSAKMSQSVSGENNPRAYDVSYDEFVSHIQTLTKQLKHRVPRRAWTTYAKEKNLPAHANVWRCGGLSFLELTSNIAEELGYENAVLDTRKQKTYNTLVEQGYNVSVHDGQFFVDRICEWCNHKYKINAIRRETSFCSLSCANLYANRKNGKNELRKLSLQKMHAAKAQITRKQQLDIFTKLRFELGREPRPNEWVEQCRIEKIPSRVGTKYGFASWLKLKEAATMHNHRVISVEPCGTEDVFNGTVDEEHTYCFGGWDIGNNEKLQIHSQNCGELPLSAGDSCRLLYVNLWKFVKDKFTAHVSFDFDALSKAAYVAQKLMDDLIDLELEAVDKIIAKIKNDPEPESVKRTELELWNRVRTAAFNGRRTGLGITALGDTIAGMNFKYGDDDSIKLTEDIYRCLTLASYRASVDMARDRGKFPVFSLDQEKDHPFIKRVMNEDPELHKAYLLYGRRNIANTTTAPVGTGSILTQTTSGCEPVLFLKSRRKRKITTADKNARVDEIDALGDKWQYYDLFHPGLKIWMDVTGETDITKSPYYGATVEEIDWLKKIDIQAAAQKWICHSISNTTNLPEDVSTEAVSKLAMHAWETGCKGVTIYRKNSRAAVIVDESAKKNVDQPSSVTETHAPKRPKQLQCDIQRVSIKGEQYVVLVGLMSGRPYEVFAGLDAQTMIPRKYKSGVLVKRGKKDGVSVYDLNLGLDNTEQDNIEDIVSTFDNPEHGALTRVVSMSLRHGVPIQYIVEQLKKDKNSDLQSFSAVIARVLKRYIEDGTKVSAEKTCSSCNATTLVYQQGCVSCTSCGWSKC